MFDEELCIVCGTLLSSDGRVYCSSRCENQEVEASPSPSSASSAFSSPQIPFVHGSDDIPPFQLGHALNSYRQRANRYSLSSESASSHTSWSMNSDEQFDNDKLGVDVHTQDADSGSTHEDHTACHGMARPSVLSYARRPSGTNSHATVTILHQRTPSSSSSRASRGPPSFHSSSLDEDEEHTFHNNAADESTLSTKARRQCNRASLPAYFSLLQQSGPVSARLSSSSNTIPRPSPSTPKITLLSMAAALPTVRQPKTRADTGSTIVPEDRGRHRSRQGVPSDRSFSRPQSRSRSQRPVESPIPDRLFDVAPRGRAAVRRNSSPLKPMVVRHSNERGPELVDAGVGRRVLREVGDVRRGR